MKRHNYKRSGNIKSVCGHIVKYGSANQLKKFYEELSVQAKNQKDLVAAEIYMQHAHHYSQDTTWK